MICRVLMLLLIFMNLAYGNLEASKLALKNDVSFYFNFIIKMIYIVSMMLFMAAGVHLIFTRRNATATKFALYGLSLAMINSFALGFFHLAGIDDFF